MRHRGQEDGSAEQAGKARVHFAGVKSTLTSLPPDLRAVMSEDS
jgi:hypothetical protein